VQEHWWKNAVIYGVDVERFCDSNGDGAGDFPGLTSKLPYLSGLGFNCVWLLPYFASPNRDNGYDITDYYRIDSKYGTLNDFLEFVRRAGEQGIRIIVDLVIHHTSDQHPWFQSARYDTSSPFRDYYVWSEQPPAPLPGQASMFPGQEDSIWTFDEVARSYYYHRFYSFQPTLNHRNPVVLDELKRVMDFWMSFGISGFRIDAASHLVENPLDPQGKGDPSHSILRELFVHATRRNPDAIMLGEVDEDESKLKTFFDGEQLNMMFNFFLDNYLLLALATGSAEPVREALARLPPPPMNGQWANFLRNLDEADLERLSEDQMDAVMKEFASRQEMRIYGRGIRRRLAPMLGDTERLKMAYSLLFAMPGAPVMCYGDEIGMGEDLGEEGRNSVRTPMQWRRGRNGGFSTAPKKKLVQPLVEHSAFDVSKVNVEDQEGNPGSLLELIRKLAGIRRAHKGLGEHDCQILHARSDAVLALAYRAPEEEIVVIHNLTGKPIEAVIELDAMTGTKPETLLGEEVEAPKDKRLSASLRSYDFRWLVWKR
jgi:maltose alpha-D-glucosyltransferase / alpha-amylase